MSNILVLRRNHAQQAEPACREWLVYLRQNDNVEVMLECSKTSYLRTRDIVLKPFRHLGHSVFAIPVED
jgi:hypothetical protein